MIEVKSLTKKYGKKIILENVSFTIEPGKKVAVVGRNGCGKTTLLQILSGSIKPDSGLISYFGLDVTKKKTLFRDYVGYVPQDLPLINELSVKDNLILWGVKASADYEYILDSFELKELLKTPVWKLSGGMKKRISIACAIAKRPSVLLLDEPSTALDIYYRSKMDEWIDEYRDQNNIILISTHEESEILSCDEVLLLKNGKIHKIINEDNIIKTIHEKLMEED